MIVWQYHPYVALVVVTAGIAGLVALYAWHRRPASGAKTLTLMMIAVAEMSLALGLEIGAQNLATLLLGRRLQAPALYTLPIFWLLFTIQYTGNQRWLRPWKVIVLLLIPASAIALEWSSSRHTLFMTDLWFNADTQPPTLGWRPGIGYVLYILYAYLVLSVASYLLIRRLSQAKDLYQEQIATLLLAIAIPWLTTILFVTRVFPPTLPAGPVAFTLSGLLLAWNLYEFRLLDIVPIARETLIERMQDAVFVLDDRYRLLDLNPSARRLCVGEDPIQVGATAGGRLPAPVLATLKNGVHGQAEISLGRGTAQRWYDLTVEPLYHRDRQIHGWVLALHDITDLRYAQQHAERARAEAEAANETKSQFISNVSHELRTPLTNIKLYIDLVKKGAATKRETYLEILARETVRLQELIEDLLYISRLDLDKIEFQPSPLDVNDLLHTLIQDRSMLFEGANLTLRFDPSPLPPVNADPTLLERVITNLLANALNYTPEGGVVVRTTTTTVDGEPWATVAVADTGLGIAQEDQARLFERFYRGNASRQAKAPGTGLGLAISQHIVALHGGRITFESTLGKGSTFTVWLPRLDRLPPNAPEP